MREPCRARARARARATGARHADVLTVVTKGMRVFDGKSAASATSRPIEDASSQPCTFAFAYYELVDVHMGPATKLEVQLGSLR